MLTKIFVTEREEVIGRCRNVSNEKLPNTYSSQITGFLLFYSVSSQSAGSEMKPLT
jgi:hypothetical protein